VFGDIQWWIMRAIGRSFVRTCLLQIRVEGLDHLPSSGPVIVAARHYHHFFDGCALITSVPRPLHLVVAVDWANRPGRRVAADLGFAAVRWPRILRSNGIEGTRSVRPIVETRSLRVAVMAGLRALRTGHIVVFFPEGYANVDPSETPKKGDDAAFLPFQPGFHRLAEIARRRLRTPIPIVPAGLDYHRGRRWQVVLRFGAPISTGSRDFDSAVRLVENEVRRLSGARC
jgi:1-acyl-sn-glycerol-3-phosphate acyltransferase